MIEIIFDSNNEDIFLHKKRQIFTIDNLTPQSWGDYRQFAQKLLNKYQEEDIIIIRNNNPQTSVNWLAVALFAESCFLETKLNAVVFQTQQYEKDIEAYKPFLALTIGIKYAIRLYKEDWKNIYKEISCLSYLGLEISEDYHLNKLLIKLPRNTLPQKLIATTLENTLTTIGIIKSLALSEIPVSIDAEIFHPEIPETMDIDKIIEEIISYVKPLIE